MTDGVADSENESAAEASGIAQGHMLTMDPEELREISGRRLSVGTEQNDQVSMMVGRMGMNIANFNTRQKRALARPGSARSKKAVAKDLLGGDKDLMAMLADSGAFGEEGSGALEGGAGTKVRAALEDKLRDTHGTSTAAVASQLMNSLIMTVDPDGPTAKDLQTKDFKGAIQSSGSLGAQGAKGGKGAQAFDQGLESVGAKLGTLSGSIQDAVDRINKITPKAAEESGGFLSSIF